MKLPESFDRAMRDLRRAQIPVYAGNAAFFLVLSFLPLLTLLLAALQYTVFRPEDLLALLSRIMPDEVLPLFSDFLQKAYQKSGAAIISLSALTAAWSASRGIYGISKGLSAVLDVPETRSYLRLRLLCLFYMLLFVLGLVLTLLFHVFGQRLLALLTRKGLPLAGMLSFLLEHLQLYSFLLLTALFSLLYLALPDRRRRLAAVFRALFRVRQPFREGTGALRKPDDDGSDHALGLRLREHRLLRRVFEPPAPAPSDGRIARVFSAAP